MLTAKSVLATCCCSLVLITVAHSREWSDATGKFKVQAKLVEVADGTVALHTEDGRDISVPLEKLSKIDRIYAEAWLKAKDGTPPALPPQSAMLLDFKVKVPDGRTATIENAGGFALRWPKQRRAILVSVVAPLRDPALGTDLSKLDKTVAGINIKDPASGKPLGKSAGVLQLTGSKATEGNDTRHDLIAFWADPAAKIGALALAGESPSVDERVWLLGLPEPEAAASGQAPQLLAAKVTEATDDHITFELDGMRVPPNCLGAPVVNFAGEVVGMFALRGGRKGTVVAVRVEDMKSRLEEAMK